MTSHEHSQTSVDLHLSDATRVPHEGRNCVNKNCRQGDIECLPIPLLPLVNGTVNTDVHNCPIEVLSSPSNGTEPTKTDDCATVTVSTSSRDGMSRHKTVQLRFSSLTYSVSEGKKKGRLPLTRSLYAT